MRDGEGVSLFVGGNGNWQRIAGPFATRDRDSQASVIVAHYLRGMTEEQRAQFDKAYKRYSKAADPFLLVGLCGLIERGVKTPLT